MSDGIQGLTSRELNKTHLFVGRDGAELTCFDRHGVVRWQLGEQPGRHFADNYAAFMRPGDRLTVEGGTFVKQGGDRIGKTSSMGFGAAKFKSGANPDWIAPERTMGDYVRQMERKLEAKFTQDMQRRDARVMARAKAELRAQEQAVIEKGEVDGETQTDTQVEAQGQQSSQGESGDASGESGKVQVPEVKADE